nr:hypothetical protein [Phycisphaerales bacterium]
MNLPLVPLIHAPRTPIAAAMVLVMLAGNAGAAVINVPADQPTVQAAIDAAVNGDVIVIAPGRYVEKIHLKGKAITVRGAMNAEDTILDGGGTPGFVVQIRNGEGPKTIIENLTITGAKGINNANIGSGVYILNTSPTLRRLIIMDNHAGPAYGGGVYIKGGAASLHQVSFTGNSALTGGNVYIESSHATIKESLFMHGNAQNGGGYAVLGGKATLHDSWFESNMANSLGGAIYVAHASLDMKNLTVRDNGKVESCGYYCVTYSPLAGGAIYASGTSGTIRDSVLENNSGAFGGAVYVAGFGSSPHFVNCVIAHNRGGTGAVYCNDSSPKFINSTIFKNTYGGVFTSSSARPTMTNSIIAGHDLPDS